MRFTKTKLTAVAVVIFIFISALNIYALNTANTESNTNDDEVFKVTNLASKAYLNPCSSILGCGTSDIFCGSITVNDADGPDYTIVCEGGGANPSEAS